MPVRRALRTLFVAILLLLVDPSRSPAVGIGTSTSTFLKLGVGARAAGMGGAFLALSDDSTAVYWNPAGLPQLDLASVSLMHLQWFDGITYDYAGYTTPIAGMAFGLGVTYLNAPPVNNTLDPNAEQASASEFSGSLAFGLPVSDQLSVGLDFKPISSDLAGASALGGALDGGLLFKPFGNSFAFAMEAQNVGFLGKYEAQSDPLPLSISLGAAYRYYDRRGDNTFNLAIDAVKAIDARVKYNLGAEAVLFDLLALRGGYAFSEGGQDLGTALSSDLSTDANLSLGAGFRLGPFQADYAFVPFGELGVTHRLSVSWTFGYWPSPRPQSELLGATPSFSGNTVTFNPLPGAGLGEVKKWKVEVTDADGRLVRVISGRGAMPKTVAWDGVDDNGRQVDAAAAYRYAFSEIDASGRHVGTQGSVAQLIKPRDMLAGGPQYSAEAGGLVFRPKSSASVNVKEWKLDIKTADGVIIKTITGTGAIPKSLVWNPRSGGGEGFIQKDVSQIQYALEIKDNAGASKVVTDVVRFSPQARAMEPAAGSPVPLSQQPLDFKPQPGKEVLICSLPNLTSFKPGEATAHPFVFKVPGGGRRIKAWRLEIREPGGGLIKLLRGDGPAPSQIVWDGRGEDGRTAPGAANCRFAFFVTAADNQEKKATEAYSLRDGFQVSVPGANLKRLSGLYFTYLSAEVRPDMEGKLRQLAAILKRSPDAQVILQGYASQEGDGRFSSTLSQDRADAILRHLIEEEGVVMSNITAIGYGAEQPNGGAPSLYRRVDVLIVSH